MQVVNVEVVPLIFSKNSFVGAILSIGDEKGEVGGEGEGEKENEEEEK